MYIQNVNKFVRDFWKVDFRGQNKYKIMQKYWNLFKLFIEQFELALDKI